MFCLFAALCLPGPALASDESQKEAAARDPSLAGSLSYALGGIAFLEGDLVAACGHFDAAAASMERSGDMRTLELALGNALFVRSYLGQYEEVLAKTRELSARKERASFRSLGLSIEAFEALMLARMGKLEEASKRAGAWIEGCRPGLDMRDVFEAACQSLQQLLLLS